MCQTALISRNVVRLSRRTYNHRLEVASSAPYSVSMMSRLNRELDSLYELIYEDWRSVSEEDYKVFGGQLQILIDTVKQLWNACKKLPKSLGLKSEVERLGMNYSALYELNADIVRYNFRLPKDERVKNALDRLSQVDAKLSKA